MSCKNLIFVVSRVGRDNKRWKQTDRRKWRREQHIFVTQDFNKKLDRMFANETKRARFVETTEFDFLLKKFINDVTFGKGENEIKIDA